MRKLLLLLAIITGINSHSFCQSNKDRFILTGEIDGVNEGMIYLSYELPGNRAINDSCRIINGHFSFKGNITEVIRADFKLKTDKPYDPDNSTSLWLEPGTMKVNVKLNDFPHLKIVGSPTHLDFQEFWRVRAAVDAKYKVQLDSLKGLRNKEMIDAIRGRLSPYFEEMDQAEIDFFAKHPRSIITAAMVGMHITRISLDSARMFYKNFGPAVQKSQFGKMIAEKIDRIEKSSPGSMVKDFSAIDVDGKLLTLSDFKGQYVLLDFWASWCVPCRKGNPHLRELYAKYKSKGMEFIGIASDNGMEDKWRQAIAKDSLPWKQVLQYVRPDTTKPRMNLNEYYGIGPIPVRILVNREGKIIGRFEEDESELDALLRKEFEF